MAIANLNGWKRLFILLSIFYAVLVAWIGYSKLPDESDVYRSTAQVYRHAIAKYEGVSPRDINLTEHTDTASDRAAVDHLLGGGYPSLSLGGILRSKQDTRKYDVTIQRVRDSHRARLGNLPDNQRTQVFRSVAVFIIPCLLVYVIGASIGWIFRDFRAREGK